MLNEFFFFKFMHLVMLISFITSMHYSIFTVFFFIRIDGSYLISDNSKTGPSYPLIDYEKI